MQSFGVLFVEAFLRMAAIEVLPDWLDVEADKKGRTVLCNDKRSEQEDLVHVGHWGNTLVRRSAVSEREGVGVNHIATQQSRKVQREAENLRHPGGMRNPLLALDTCKDGKR